MIELFSKLEEIKEKEEYVFFKTIYTVDKREIQECIEQIMNAFESVGVTDYEINDDKVLYITSNSIKVTFVSDKDTMTFLKNKFDLEKSNRTMKAIFNNDFLGQWIIHDNPNPPSPYEPFSSIEFNSDNMNIEIAGEPGVRNRNGNFYPEHTLREAFDNIRWN